MGFFNTGTANAGFFQDNALTGQGGMDSGAYGSGHYPTGGVSAASLGSGVLNSFSAATGGLNAGLPGAGVFNPAATAAFTGAAADPSAFAGGVQSGPSAGVASAASGPTPTPPALRTTTSAPAAFFPGGGNEVRGPATTREPGIPNSGFFNKPDRDLGAPDPGIRMPDITD